MRVRWQRYEGPTWIVALLIYSGWFVVALLHRQLTPWIAVPLAIYLTAWHSSFQHETIHAMRRVPRRVRTLIASPPLGIWFPYELYRREHLRHHAVRELTGPADPESFYVEPEAWFAMPSALRALYLANQTLAGRLLIGPALVVGRAYVREIRLICAGDTAHALLWIRHLAASACVLWFLDAVTGVAPVMYLVVIAYPAASLSLLRSFVEHRAAENPADRTATVVSRSALSLLFLNNNFHATHHERPTLPWYEIPAYWHARQSARPRQGVTYAGGYRQIARSWLWRPFDRLVRTAASGARFDPNADAACGTPAAEQLTAR